MTTPKQYAERDAEDLCDYYVRHVQAMTAEDLHAKWEIAAELAWRDREIDRLRSMARPGFPVPHGSAVEAALYSAALARRFTHDEDWAQVLADEVLADEVLADEVRRLRMLLQQMLDVAENCDETGYADGVGFVDIDKLHAQVREALSLNVAGQTAAPKTSQPKS